MTRKQRISVRMLSAHGTRGRLYILLQSLRRFFALIHTSPFSRPVQWKPASCNGKARPCNGKPLSCSGKAHPCNGKPHLVQWKVGLHNCKSKNYTYLADRLLAMIRWGYAILTIAFLVRVFYDFANLFWIIGNV